MASPGKTELPPEQGERVRNAMKELINSKRVKNKAALARAIGISQTSVGQNISGKTSPALRTAQKVAKLMGVHLGELLGTQSADLGEEPPDSCAPRARALKRLRGLIAPEVAADLRAFSPHGPHGAYTEMEWIRFSIMHQADWEATERLRQQSAIATKRAKGKG